MIVRGQSVPNISALRHDERKAIGQAPIFIQAAGEKTDGGLTQVFGMRDHFDERIAADLLEAVCRHLARNCPRQRVHPFPAHGFRGDNHGTRFDQIKVPRQGVAMVLIACAGQGDPERSVGEKERDLTYLRLVVP